MKPVTILAAIAGAALISPLARADTSLAAQVIAYEGLAPLQVPVGAVYSGFGVPSISPDGRFIAAAGTLAGGGFAADSDEFTFLFTLSPFQALPIGREGASVPNQAGWLYRGNFEAVRVNNQGRLLFIGDCELGVVSGRGVFVWPNGSGTALPAQQMALPPTQATYFTTLGHPAIDGLGRVAAGLYVQIQSTFFSGLGSTLRVSDPTVPGPAPLVALTGDPAIHLGFGAFWQTIPVGGSPRITDDGYVYFQAFHGGLSGAAAHAVYQWTPQGQTMVVRGGPTANQLVSLGEPTLLSAASGGHALFTAKLLSLVTTEQNDDVLWCWHHGVRSVVAQEDAAAPGIFQGRFDWFSAESYMNDSGHIAFTAGIRGMVTNGSNSAVYRDTGSGPELLIQEGDAAPGLPGVHFGQLYAATLNNPGQVAIFNALTGAGITSENDYSLWIWTPGRGLTLVAREGDAYDVGFGPDRILKSFAIRIGGPSDGQGSFLADNGRMVFRATFTDNSTGIFATVVNPPCYANCDNSTTAPVLNIADFSCFLNKFAAADSYANCDGSTTAPVLNIADFSCFLNQFAAGCP